MSGQRFAGHLHSVLEAKDKGAETSARIQLALTLLSLNLLPDAAKESQQAAEIAHSTQARALEAESLYAQARTKRDERILLCAAAFDDDMENLLIEFREAGDRAKDAWPAKLLASPVEAEIADNRPQPRRKLCRPLRIKTSQPAKAMVAELFANKLKTVRSVVGVALEMADDLKNERRVRVNKRGPCL